MIAVRDCALMLHSEMRRLDEFVAVGVPRIRAEPVLEAVQYRDHLLELTLRGVRVISERPEVERQSSGLAVQGVTEMSVLPRVDRDVVIVDRAGHEPFVRRRAVAIVCRASQPAV